MYHLASNQCQHRFDLSNRLLRHRQVVVAEDCQVGVLSLDERADVVVVEGEPRGALRVQAQRLQRAKSAGRRWSAFPPVSDPLSCRKATATDRGPTRLSNRFRRRADPGVDDPAKGRSPAADKVGPRLGAGAGAEILQRFQPRLVDALQVNDRPAQPSIGYSRAIDSNASRWKSFSLIVMECCCSSQPCFAIMRAVGSNCGDIVSVPPIRSPKPADPEQIVADCAAATG